MDMGKWLRDAGFERYEPLFAEHAIDADVLGELTELDLEKLQIPLGDRKRLLKAIRAFAESDSGKTEVLLESTVRQPQVAERRHLTVMICDLVGSTALSARLDPEDTAAVFDAFHSTCARIVKAYDGFLSDFRGDGISGVFRPPARSRR